MAQRTAVALELVSGQPQTNATEQASQQKHIRTCVQLDT